MRALEKITRNIQARGVKEFATESVHFVRGELSRLVSPNVGPGAQRDKFHDLRMLCSSVSPTIVDGGAFKGETIDRFLETFAAPRIYAFEANPELARDLEPYNRKHNVTVFNLAVGDRETEVEFNITKDPGSSSVLPSTTRNVSAFGAQVINRDHVTVEQRRLDDVLDHPPDIVKLDIQGYELQALRGLERYLADVELVVLEVGFRELYEGQAEFCDISSYLRERGFELFNLYEYVSGESGELAQADAIFVNRARR